jgi:hypothetical protein
MHLVPDHHNCVQWIPGVSEGRGLAGKIEPFLHRETAMRMLASREREDPLQPGLALVGEVS